MIIPESRLTRRSWGSFIVVASAAATMCIVLPSCSSSGADGDGDVDADINDDRNDADTQADVELDGDAEIDSANDAESSDGDLDEEETALRRVLSEHVVRYQFFTIQDLYKLLYQASFGSEHAVGDRESARAYLENELQNLGEGPEEPDVDRISPNGRLARVNLRPFVAGGGDHDALLDAFIRTAEEFHGSRENFIRYWSYAENMASDDELPFEPSDMASYFSSMESGGFPAVHHSTQYASANNPAYRVVIHEFLTD